MSNSIESKQIFYAFSRKFFFPGTDQKELFQSLLFVSIQLHKNLILSVLQKF